MNYFARISCKQSGVKESIIFVHDGDYDLNSFKMSILISGHKFASHYISRDKISFSLPLLEIEFLTKLD